jgi:two-component system, response regulator YesN
MARKLLIVEDERAEREGLESFVDWGSLGIELLPSASDGEEGLARILAESPSIVITDVRMPVMGGLEMIERSRGGVAGGSVPPEFIIASGYDEFDYARRALRLGAAEYLLKPVERESLMRCLEACLERASRRERESLSWAALAPAESAGYKEADAAFAALEASMRSLDRGRVEASIARLRTALREPKVHRDAVLGSIVDRWLSASLEFVRKSAPEGPGETGGAAMIERMRAAPDLEALCDAVSEIGISLARELELDAGEKRARVVRLAVEALTRDYAKSISLRSVADGIGVSPNYLGKLFTEVEGMGFSDYLTQLRMAEAQRLLVEGKLKVKAVAEAVGCPNVPYFCTLFKSVYGVSPSRYAEA